MLTDKEVEKLREYKIMLGVPMYGGQCYGLFLQSVSNLYIMCQQLGIKIQPFFILNESLITRARNYIADEFLRSDCTHLMFIDSDIAFKPGDVLVLLKHSVMGGDDKDVVCAPYPKKNISWEKVAKAVNAGEADQNPNNLENFIGDYVFNVVDSGTHKMNELIEVQESGTGFMLIKREVFDKFKAAYPEYEYYPDHKRTKDFKGDRLIHGYFMDPIHDKRHLSEDYFFCHWIRRIGMKVWIAPWMKLDHLGFYIFHGNLEATLALGLSPTIASEDVARV